MKRRRRDLGPPAAASSLATRPTTSSIFRAGVIPARTFPMGISHARATRSALPWLSPVSMTTSAPLSRSDATAPGAVARRASSHRSAPAQSPSTPTHSAVAPARSHSAAAAARDGSSRPQPRRLARAGPPISTSLPSTLALAPSPGRVSNSVTLHCLAAMRTAAPLPASTAAATGCEARSSSAHAQRSSAPAPSAGLGFSPSVLGVASFTCVMVNLPSVSVPVLSTQISFSLPSLSRCADPLTSIPRLAARVSPHTATTGVDSTSAHGHATTRSTHAM